MTERKRLIADRFRRIWHVVEEIAANPGQSRRNLADTFFLSERQVQADLNIIRSDMRLPLVRRQGYRFADEGTPGGAGAMTLQEAQLLVMVMRQAMKDRSIPNDRLRTLVAKLPAIFPPHLQPLVALTLDAVGTRTGRDQQIFAALGDALLRRSQVKLHHPEGLDRWYGAEPIVRPELLLPYLRRWYLVAEIERSNGRCASVMVDLSAVTAVTLQAEPAGRAGR